MELQLFSDPVTEEVEEPSVLEYAREQGICVDYTTDLLPLADLCLSLRDTIDQDPRDPFYDDLTNAVAAASELLKPRLTLTTAAAGLLKSALTAPGLDADYCFAADGRPRIRDLKHELPVLRTDPELDMLSFGTKFEPDFRELRSRIPSEDVDEEEDEGFGWPAKYAGYPAQVDKQIRSERLVVTRDVLLILQGAMRDDFTPEEDEKVLMDALESRKEYVPRHLTPPLLPLSPPLTPYIPSSPANRLPLIPESSDPIVAEAKALEQQIMAKDSLLRRNSGSSDSMLLDVGDLDALFAADAASSPPSSERIPTILKRKADDLKVEGPLTPPMFSDSPMKKLKSVSFSNMIQVGNTLEPWPDKRPRTSDSQITIDELLKEIEPIAKEAKRKAENEKLIGADTVARVDIPVMDFTLPVAPWDEFSQRRDGKRRTGTTELEAQMRFLHRVKRDDLKSATTWHGISDLDYSWGWFASPTSGSIKLQETLHGETDFNKIQAELTTGTIATSSTELWKRDGLRLLDEVEDEYEDEDEVEPAEFEERDDMDALIRKRKLEMEDQDQLTGTHRTSKDIATVQPVTQFRHQPLHGSSPAQERFAGVHDPHKTHRTTKESQSRQTRSTRPPTTAAAEQKHAPTELMFGGFSATTALHKFMETQGKAIQLEKITPESNNSAAPAVQNLTFDDSNTSGESRLLAFQRSAHAAEHPKHATPEQISPFNLPVCSLVISSTLLQRRALVKEVERLHPKAELIYRDYILPHSGHTDADIILSPSTGVLLTTLQQIKQQPLPGQKALSPVKERMLLLQERYERLVVLVSEGLREESSSRPEDVRDKETLKRLGLFAAKLEGDIAVTYVPGGEQAFARAIVESVQVYGLPHGGEDMHDIKLLPVETTWEVFLGRAGLNPFAAQVIIASLKIPTTFSVTPSLMSSPTSYSSQETVEATGLSTFLLMDQDDRAKHFQAIMGGRRILDRVSALLDQRWPSAAHGFRM
ncbi:hypothetical protein C7974DRAFT_368528 [Boeremia exigua]|uniref:uncharacterized protein n=1 Tax=Boeremia exigua TaxID=749465 RepID=UPI001E8E8906|nr:uncharacterized protein C7974DRAFT_368528 [Boeremia exigua]KAH6614257.1 hypothetical protein C7974DRAFT_368528 [Boeremia exigua]